MEIGLPVTGWLSAKVRRLITAYYRVDAIFQITCEQSLNEHALRNPDDRVDPRLGWDRLLGHLLLVDAPAFLATGNDAEGIARRDQADRDALEGGTRFDQRSASEGQ
jgi:hypothetical protein